VKPSSDNGILGKNHAKFDPSVCPNRCLCKRLGESNHNLIAVITAHVYRRSTDQMLQSSQSLPCQQPFCRNVDEVVPPVVPFRQTRQCLDFAYDILGCCKVAKMLANRRLPVPLLD
jgi:hypothetical protein